MNRHIEQHSSLKRRQLMKGLLWSGLGLTALGGGVGASLGSMKLLSSFSLPSFSLPMPAQLPVDSHRLLNFSEVEEPLYALTWLPDNTHLLVFDFQELFLLDVQSGKKEWVQPSPFQFPITERMRYWSFDRRYVAEIGLVNPPGANDQFEAVVWDLKHRQLLWKSPQLGASGHTVFPCALSSDGGFFAQCQLSDPNTSRSDTIVRIWNIQKNRLFRSWNTQEQGQYGKSAVITMAWSPDNTRLALSCADDSVSSVQVWNSTKGTRLWTYPIANGRGGSLQWSPDGTTLAFHGNDPILMLDTHTGELLFQTTGVDFSTYDVNGDPTGESHFLVWSSDSKRLALLTYENTVQVCDARTGQHLFTCQRVDGHLTGCSWSPDGRYLAAGNLAGGSEANSSWGENSTIQFWDAQSGKALFAYQAPRAPGQLVWSPDSHFLAASNPQDHMPMGRHIYFSNFALQVFRVA